MNTKEYRFKFMCDDCGNHYTSREEQRDCERRHAARQAKLGAQSQANMKLESALLGCPFCGGESVLNGTDECGFFVSCKTAGCYGFNDAKWGRAETIAAFNRRLATQPAQASEEK